MKWWDPIPWSGIYPNPIPKKGNAKECSNYHTIVLISHASNVMLKILQSRLQQYINHELPDVQAGFEKQKNQRSNCQHLLDHWKAREFQRNIYFCFIDYAKAFDYVDHNQLWKILQEIWIPAHLTCLLRKLYTDRPRQYIKKQRHYFDNKGLSSQTMVFSVVMYGRDSWTIKKAEHLRIYAFLQLWCWRRLLRVPWTARRFNQSI